MDYETRLRNNYERILRFDSCGFFHRVGWNVNEIIITQKMLKEMNGPSLSIQEFEEYNHAG